MYNRAIISLYFQITVGFDKGGSFAVYYKGELVVNVWGGWAHEDADQTLTNVTIKDAPIQMSDEEIVGHMLK